MVALASPVALAVATAVYQKLTDKAGEALVRKGGRFAGPLTIEQRTELRRVAEERARTLGLTEDKVPLLVGAILDGLDRDG